GGHRLHRRPAPFRLRDRAARATIRRPFTPVDPPPQPHAACAGNMNHARLLLAIPLCAALLAVAGCSSRSSGGYYKDDGPGSNIPADIQSIPDAVPRVETHARANFRPYVVFGKRYVPIAENQPYRQTGVAS